LSGNGSPPGDEADEIEGYLARGLSSMFGIHSKGTGKKGRTERDRIGTIVLLSTMLAIASLLIRQYNEADTWWQVAIGRDILSSWSVPRFDHYTLAV